MASVQAERSTGTVLITCLWTLCRAPRGCNKLSTNREVVVFPNFFHSHSPLLPHISYRHFYTVYNPLVSSCSFALFLTPVHPYYSATLASIAANSSV